MKAYQGLWKILYARFSGKHNVPGERPGMQVDEFEDFVDASGFVNDLFAFRDSSLIFNLSMFT